MTRAKPKKKPSAVIRSSTADTNRIVHGLWIGSELSRLELLTLHSFVRFGHEFHLWVYDDLKVDLPKGVRLRNANEILPRARVFKKAAHDAEAGLGRGSYGPFSDLFRYKLLWQHGGIWVDMDVTCLKRFDFRSDFLFRSHRIGMVGNVMKAPRRSELMRATFKECDAIANEHVDWLTPNRVLNKHVVRLGLQKFIRSDFSNVDQWVDGVAPFVEENREIPRDWYCIHWMNEAWRSLKDEGGRIGGRHVVDYTPDKNVPFAGSTLSELYRHYGLLDPRDQTAPTLKRPDNRDALAVSPSSRVSSQFNVLVPNLRRTDNRAVADTVRALSRRNAGQSVYALEHTRKEFSFPESADTRVTFLGSETDGRWHRRVAFDVLAGSRKPSLYSHRIRVGDLKRLERLGVTPIPVVEEAEPDWLDPPRSYNDLDSPFVVAACDAIAADMARAGCRKPLIVLRHELPQRFVPAALAQGRAAIREKYGVDDDTILIGMIGPFTPHKGYTRAVRALAALRAVGKAKLLIVGDRDEGHARSAYEAAMRQAIDAGVASDIFVASGEENTDPYFGAFDVFLNTSVSEALSLPLLEAELAGCPIVAADVGGNREALPPEAVLVKDPANISAYVDGILQLLNRRQRVLPPSKAEPDLIARLWTLLARFGGENRTPPVAAGKGTLFVTASLHLGGPTSSLVNLLGNLPDAEKNILCVLDGISAERAERAIRAAQIPLLRTEKIPGLVDRVEQILRWAEQFNVANICFWNAPPEIKLLLAKVLLHRTIKLIDVSPGPMLFDELSAAEPFQRRIALTAPQYIARLDTFVSLYRKGTPRLAAGVEARATRIIPLGVPMPPQFVPLPPAQAMPPPGLNPRYAIGTCCRVVPDKRLEFLLDMMKLLVRRVPEASLTIVGGPDHATMDYWNGLMRRVKDEGLSFVRFVGRQEDVTPFLATFKVFVMVSDRQGCPNASLEAMAMRLPVVANPSGGTGEQVKNGVNGYLVENPAAMAKRVEKLLLDPRLRRKLGTAGFNIVRKHFSVPRMIAEYEALLTS